MRCVLGLLLLTVLRGLSFWLLGATRNKRDDKKRRWSMNGKNVTRSAKMDPKDEFLKYPLVFVLETIWSCGCSIWAARWAP